VCAPALTRHPHRADTHRPAAAHPPTGQNHLVPRRIALILQAVLVALVLAAGAACAGGGGSQTQCGIDGCTVTFPRSGDASVSVLGVDARLLGVQNGTADIEVAGQRLAVPVGGETSTEGFTVGVQEVTDTAVVVRIRLA
jgi:hypothetical protein